MGGMPMDKTTSRIAQGEFLGIEMRLEAVLAVVRNAKDTLEKAPDTDELWTFRRWSLDNGLKTLEAFAAELRNSTIALASGQPMTADTTKSTVRKKKAVPKNAAAKKPRAKKAAKKSGGA